ncbi:MAG TPA: hypothetical protein IAA51_12635 [Candidatus Cottocaccamicrobium excrementipullorum]|nr:hypothetical protein [Candidatus Cottocaccamicrobium excrementipullorum]
MRKNYMFLAAACVALGITACGQKKSETAPVPSTQTETAQESAAETETAETKESSQAEEEAEEKTVTGRVTGVEDTVITLSGQNDLEYQIDLADANTAGSLEVGEGDQIMVTFMDDDQEIKKAESYDILTSAAQEGEQDPVIAGEITDAAMNTIALEAESGNTYHFSTLIAQKVTGDSGIVVGENVEITYLGSLPGEGEEGTALRVTTEEAAGDAAATYKTLEGAFVSADDGTILLEADNGEEFSFQNTEDLDVSEIAPGDRVVLTYNGSLTNGEAVAEELELAD